MHVKDILSYHVEDIQDDMKRRRIRAARDLTKDSWTVSPNSNSSRRGRSVPGVVLGPGPLPPSATGTLEDPRLSSAVKRFYWYGSDGKMRYYPQNHFNPLFLSPLLTPQHSLLKG